MLRLMDWSIGFMLNVDGMRSMRVYHQNILTTKQFIDEVLNYCIGGPAFIVDNASWLNMH
jgi:transposase-like protein